MSCCEKTVTRQTFLEEKLRNFKAFLTTHSSSEELKTALDKFDTLDSIMPFLLQAVAAHSLGKSDALLDKFCEPFALDADALPPFRAKVQRYLDMFREVLGHA